MGCLVFRLLVLGDFCVAGLCYWFLGCDLGLLLGGCLVCCLLVCYLL